MNILALTAYFAPEQYASSHLTDNYCEAFAQSGFEMYIYTPCPTRGINDEEREKYKKHLKYESLNDGKLHVYRFPLMREGKSPIKRALRYFLECFKHYYYGCKNKNADVLFVTSTPPIQGAMAALVKKKQEYLLSIICRIYFQILWSVQDWQKKVVCFGKSGGR